MEITFNTISAYNSITRSSADEEENKKHQAVFSRNAQTVSAAEVAAFCAQNQQQQSSEKIELTVSDLSTQDALSRLPPENLKELSRNVGGADFGSCNALVNKAAKSSGEKLSDTLNQQNGSDASQQQNSPQGKTVFSTLFNKQTVELQNTIITSGLVLENSQQRQSADLATLSAKAAKQQGDKTIDSSKEVLSGKIVGSTLNVSAGVASTVGAVNAANKSIKSAETNLRTNVTSRQNLAESENAQTTSLHSQLSEGENVNPIYETSLKQPKAAQEADNQYRQIDHDNIMREVNKDQARTSLATSVLNQTGEIIKSASEVSAATERSAAIQDGVAKETLSNISANQKKRADKTAEIRDTIMKVLNESIASDQNTLSFVAEKKA